MRIEFRRTLPFLIITSLSLARGMQAQEKKDTMPSLDEVVVSATRVDSRSVTLPYVIGVRTREDASRQVSRTVPESLSGMPGVFIQKTNHAGGSPFIRGLTGNQTLILVDGIRLNNSIFRYGPNQYLTLIDPSWVDRVEVVKGTGSVQYGSDAMTGVVNVRTTSLKFREKPQWNERISTRITGGGMEFTVIPQVVFEGRRFAFVTSMSSKRFGDLRGGDTTGFQRPSGYRERSFESKMMADLGRNWKLTGNYHFLQQDDVPVYHKYILENFALHTSDPISRGFGYLRLNKEFPGRFVRKIEISLSSQEIAESRHQRKNGSTSLRYEMDRASTLSASADMLFQFSRRWQSNTGLEWTSDRIRSRRSDTDMSMGTVRALRGLYPDGSGYTNASLYSLHHLDLGSLRVEAGLRYSQYRASIVDTTLGPVIINPGALVFQAGLNYRIMEGWHVYAQASEGYRAPNIDDLGTLGIVDFRYEVPAYDLRPERSMNFETGMKYAGTRTNASVSIFRTNLTDLITRVKTGAMISGYQVYQKVNVDRGYIRGWEAQAEHRFPNGIRIHGSATRLFGQSVTRNEPLRRIPPFNSRAGIEYERGRFRTGFIYDHADPQRRLDQGDRSDNRIPVGGTPGYDLINLYAAYRSDLLTFRLYLDNIFNQDYRTHGSGINGMGRAISAVVIISLKQ